MPSRISNADLLQKLQDQATAAARAADTNHDGNLTPADVAALPAGLKSVATRLAAGGTVKVDAFVAAYAQDARDKLGAADKNRDGFLSSTEKKSLPAALMQDINALSTPSPRPAGTGAAFGISGTVPASAVTLKTVLATGFDKPTGMAFNPKDGSLWILNHGNDTSVVIDQPGTALQSAHRYQDHSAHFMNKPMAIAFSPTLNEFASVQESENAYSTCHDPDMQRANMFMGPTLFTADRTRYDGGEGSHLDMLHHSPLSVGIAAGSGPAQKREYWVFNGQSGCIDRYFFNRPHELGGTNHADGQTFRYAPGELKRVPGVPGHIALDPATGNLYIADTGHGRIVRLDTRGDVASAATIRGWHDETALKQIPGTHVQAVTDASAGLGQPAGLLIHQGKLVVGDYATGHIKVFSKEGKLEGDVDTGLGPRCLTGLAESPDGRLFLLDTRNNKLLTLEIH